jgi:hypothetical protein
LADTDLKAAMEQTVSSGSIPQKYQEVIID